MAGKTTMKSTLWIDVQGGISGDRFAGALIGLGAPERGMKQAIQSASEELGMMDVHTHLEFLPDERIAHQFHIISLEERETLHLQDAPAILDKVLERAKVRGTYANFARLALGILSDAEARINLPIPSAPDKTVSLSIIGTAHTPYTSKAPYQPQSENLRDGEFYIQVAPQYLAATQSLETFSHIF